MSDDTTWSSLFDIFFPNEIWGPVSNMFASGLENGLLIASAAAIGYIVLLYIEKTKEIPGAWNPWVIFWIILLNGILLLFIAWWMSPIKFFGTEILSAAPNSCIGKGEGEYGSLEGGLCYKNCKKGYHGVADRCWADTVNIGFGTVVGLEPCPVETDGQGGWTNMGLTCTRWKRECVRWGIPGIAQWWTGCAETVGRLDKGGVCPGPQDFGNGEIRTDSKWDNDYRQWKASNDKGDPLFDPVTKEVESIESARKGNRKQCADVAATTGKHTEWLNIFGNGNRDIKPGMCYNKCPDEFPDHVPLMPYLCYKGGDTGLSYSRGVGRIPCTFRLLDKYCLDVPPKIPVANTVM